MTATPLPDLRTQILTAAMQVLHTEGLKAFTQTRVAEVAGIRQSHLTYYYPTRADLLEAMAGLVLDGVTAHIAEAARTRPEWGTGPLLEALARKMVGTPHMRMFLAMIVEGDRDPAIQALVSRGAARVREAIAAALGGPDADARARVVQAAIWGLGLYTFALRPTPDTDPLNDTLNLLEELTR